MERIAAHILSAKGIAAVPDSHKRGGCKERVLAVVFVAKLIEKPKRQGLIRHTRPTVEQLVTAAPKGKAGVRAQRKDNGDCLLFEHIQVMFFIGITVAGKHKFLPAEDSVTVAKIVKR